jgi:hypothetical protein
VITVEAQKVSGQFYPEFLASFSKADGGHPDYTKATLDVVPFKFVKILDP